MIADRYLAYQPPLPLSSKCEFCAGSIEWPRNANYLSAVQPPGRMNHYYSTGTRTFSSQGVDYMSTRQGKTGRLLLGIVALLAGGLLVRATSAADAPGQDAVIQAQIEAGEFAPALDSARRIPKIHDRDLLLAQIAVGQAEAGVREGSMSTASEISDDRARSKTLSRVAGVPVAHVAAGLTPTSNRSKT